MKWLNVYKMRVLVGTVNVAILIQPAIGLDSEGVRPIAYAGSSRYAAHDPIVLDGTDSYDPDGPGSLSYTWQQIAGPSVIIIDANTATPMISGIVQTDEIQECEFELVVGDGELISLPDTVKVIIVPDFGINKLIHINPPFDPDKPTWVSFGGLGGCRNVGSNESWFANYPEGWDEGAKVRDEKTNWIWFKQFNHSSVTIKQIGDMFIVYLSSQAPDYKQPIQSDGTSAGGEPAIDIGIHLNETYADRRYAVNRVTLFDAAGYCRDYKASIARFLASAVDGEQCWIDSYPGTLPGSYGMKMDYGFQSNVLNVWFDAATGPGGVQYKHELPGNFYGNSLIDKNLQEFNHGVIAGSFWSVLGPGKNLQLASTPGVETYKFTWYGDASSGYMVFFDESLYPGRLPEPVTLLAYSDALDPNDEPTGALLTCKESENAVAYQLLFGPDAYRVMDYNIISDTSTPPAKIITTFPFKETFWTIKARDQYGSTIYADPIRVNLENLLLMPPIDNLTNGRRYGYIQLAINDANSGDEIVVNPGIYQEVIYFHGKNLTLRSTEPNDPMIVADTIVKGLDGKPTVTFSNRESAACVLTGLTVQSGTVGVSCRDAAPMIRNCVLESPDGIAIEYWHGHEPRLIDCTVLGRVKEGGDPGLIAYWKLDETEGDIASDSANDNDGNVYGDPAWQPDSGMVNGALELDGIDDYVNTDYVLNPAEGWFSVFVWVKGGAPGQAVLSQMGGARWLFADPSEGNLMTELKGTGRGASELLSQTIITDGNWHRIGLVWDGSHRTLYVDDIAVAEDTLSNLEVSENRLYIGTGKAMKSGTYFSGLIDDVRIYNRALNAEEIAALAQ